MCKRFTPIKSNTVDIDPIECKGKAWNWKKRVDLVSNHRLLKLFSSIGNEEGNSLSSLFVEGSCTNRHRVKRSDSVSL